MEVEIISKTKTKLEIKLPSADHTLCNAIKEKLNQNENVKVATYAVRHPLVGVPQFMVETNTKTTPLEAFVKAAKELKSELNKLAKSIDKELK